MQPKSIGESLIRGAAWITEPLARRELAKRIARGEEDPERAGERQGESALVRPEGTLVWCHVKGLAGALNLNGVIRNIQAEMPDVSFLITTVERVSERVFTLRMPVGTLHQYVPLDKPAAIERFLGHWAPDLCVWADDGLLPVLNTQVSRNGIPSVLANVQHIDKENPQLRWLPSVAKPVMRGFSVVLAGTKQAQEDLRGLGVEAEVMGVLAEEVPALPHVEARRVQLSRQLAGRPVWLAARVSTTEIKWVLDAHKIAARSSQGLLLILVPENPEDVEIVERGCSEQKMNWKNSTELSELGPRIDVIIAKGLDGLGLWYQMASICFAGGSLSKDGGHSPLEPAALGSAVIHGPNVDNYADVYLRMHEAGAAIEVASVVSLAEAVTELIVPDRAAEMAHGGWMVCSQGADATDYLVDAIWELLPMGAEE